MRPRFPAGIATIAILSAVYFVASKLGLMLAFIHASASPV